MHKRMIGIFCLITLLMSTLICRIYYINMSEYITMSSTNQGGYQLDLFNGRGNIYDRKMKSLVNNSYKYIAAVLPSPAATTAFVQATKEDTAQKEIILTKLSQGQPFAAEVSDNNIYATGIDVFRVPIRYNQNQIAPHIIGYLGGDGVGGVAGIEKAYDTVLKQTGARIAVRYQMDAAGRPLEGGKIDIKRENEDNAGGVVLSIDKDIQQVAQDALAAGCEKGAAVVMSVATGEIVAMASIPVFDQNDIAGSLSSTDAPFINRAISGFNIGSVFKLVIATAALENNISKNYYYECKGFIDIGGQIFRCNNHAIHGALDMKRALEVSCNTYFINLASQIDKQYLLSLASHLGFGKTSELAPGLLTQPGNMPAISELQNPAALANFAFGQGNSLATPLQMTQVVATIANGGVGLTPNLIQGITEDGIKLSERYPFYASNQIISEETAKTMRELMIAVIEEGSGKPARPISGGAGGKTSSAQTGQMIETADGEKELVHAWFVGFYPAKQPKYSIVIFVEGGESGEKVAAPIFKQIVDSIAGLES